MADNLRILKQNLDTAIDPTAGVGEILAQEHNDVFTEFINKSGKYTGFPFISKKEVLNNVFKPGLMSWNGNAFNDTSDFTITFSEKTADLNKFGIVLDVLSNGAIIHFKDYVGRSVILIFKSYTIDTDEDGNVIFNVLVAGVSDNPNYTYQINESEQCIIEFITSNVILKELINTNKTDISNLQANKVAISSIVDNLTSSSTEAPLSANQGKILKGLIDAINNLLASDEVSLDELQEIVDFIQQNKEDLNTLTIGNIAGLQTALNDLVTAIDTKAYIDRLIDGKYGITLGGTGTGTHSNWYKVEVWNFTPTNVYGNIQKNYSVIGRNNYEFIVDVDIIFYNGVFLKKQAQTVNSHGNKFKLVLDKDNAKATIYFQKNGDYDTFKIITNLQNGYGYSSEIYGSTVETLQAESATIEYLEATNINTQTKLPTSHDNVVLVSDGTTGDIKEASMRIKPNGDTELIVGAVMTINGHKQDLNWHYVDEAGEPAFQNSWVDINTNKTRFRKYQTGQVEIQGEVKDGTTKHIFTLPVGYRPDRSLKITTNYLNEVCMIVILANGAVWLTEGDWSGVPQSASISCTFYAHN